MKFIGSKLVDRHPPHVTLKTKFTLKEGFLEKDLIELLQKFEMPKIQFPFEGLDRFGDALVLTGSHPTFLEKHKEIVALLKGCIETINPNWESDNFSPHLTIVRDPENHFWIEKEILGMKEVLLDTLQLFEMDTTPEKRFSRLVYSKELLES